MANLMCIYIYIYFYLFIYLYIHIYIYTNRGEWHILGTTYQIMRRRKRRARRERATFFTILPTHGVTAAATLSHNVQREVIHVPIDCIYNIYIHILFRERRPFPPHESAQQGHALVEAKAAKAVGEAKVEPEL